ncbi:aKG-HExxH-type peptide beta-hydroxylase [Streptomyces poonensis]|uniref:HEXXH motif domain-containing protein n=1 Tax=Streptomyces poonensis TaxID=68255 RepID=A0A918P6X9_9ACTN|nr:HEXXH motif-containing putative peptide modification protein [Streptomyces poonensis]GGY88951.1 HEXXH motif domain-containing protein [Streptomyces poonensis]GLJ93917.1 HEXXH motif domain-containing protein [Streptomyces poonensis]
MLPVVPDRALAELGRTGGGPDTLALLVRDQDTRRLLMLRAVLDAAEGADARVCSAAARRRLREDWALLEAADRVGPPGPGARATGRAATEGAEPGHREPPDPGPGHAGRPPVNVTPAMPAGNSGAAAFLPTSGAPGAADPLPAAGPPGAAASLSPARARLLHPLVGAWARHCLRGLDAGAEPRAESQRRALADDLAHFSALAAAAAARAGLSFAVRLTAPAGVLTLPSLGALRMADAGSGHSEDVRVDVAHRGGRLTLRRPGAADVVLHLEAGIGAWSSSPGWTPAYALTGLLPGAPPMPLDDLDPYRTVPGEPDRHGPSGPVTLNDAERKRWVQTWAGTAAALRPGGEHRVTEALILLRCLVPLSVPPGAAPGSRGTGSCSATRREAFGALLSSTPQSPTMFAATLVHELHHTKLSALTDMVTLHHADGARKYFAPWRPDPRPYDGLLQGTYSHLALADFFQRRALTARRPSHRETAWAVHARYREQVGAALPALVASPDLTARGRLFVDEMIAVYEQQNEHPAPRGHAARARAYVEAARALWAARMARPAE